MENVRPAPSAYRYILPLVGITALLSGLGFGWVYRPPAPPQTVTGPQPAVNAPDFQLPRLDNLSQNMTVADLKGEPALLNFWASWCKLCKQEHPVLMELAEQKGVKIFSVAYLDKADAAQEVLQKTGNPYVAVALDAAGQTGRRYNIIGTPVTLVLDKDARILYRHTGPMTLQLYEQTVRPLLDTLSLPPAPGKSG